MKLLILAAILLLAGCGTPETADLAETIPVVITITDIDTGVPVNAAIFADNQRIALDVSAYTLRIAVDGAPHELRVEATGYQVWTLKIAGELRPGRRLSGPVQLRRLPG